ncbi:MAG TPA: sulfatase [Candidatus Hydrogenedentes bacterium]|jgi:arylsulfatase A-like enzyme|nr:sulfatase [Candidatus Hydrogenedentota bacterium]
MRRRDFIAQLTGGLALAGISCARAAAPARPSRPNVIYLFSDEHRWQSMSFTEMAEVHTPHMAALAAQGVEFTQAISNYPVCSPHRAILMTGRWPYQQGVIDNNIALDPGQPTLGKVFQSAGYRTGYIGKWHLGGTRAEPFGFETSLIWTGTGTHYDKAEYHPANGEPVRPRGYNATLMTGQAIEFIRQSNAARQPFFLMLSWNPPHSTFTDAPEDKKALYPEGSLPWRPNVRPARDAAPADPPDIALRNDWPNYQGYHAHITAIDEELGRILAVVDELGLARNTIVVYTSDHGSMFGSHGVGSKRQPYEESIRVPFLIRWPGVISPGRRSEALFGSIDIMPTLCALAGLDIPPTCAGQDFSLILTRGSGPDPDAQFIMHIAKENASGGNKHPAPLFRGVRTKTHTFAVKPDGSGVLFDNRRDPFQLNNLFSEPGAAALRGQLEALTRRFLESAQDPFEMPG